MTRVFGEVAAIYDDVRAGYPDELLTTLTTYHGSVPPTIADLGAGTGKATELLLRLGVPVTAVEPDPRMSAVLHQKFPQVEVVTATLEEWTPPPGGVGLLTCATAWHWTDEKTRHQNARAALMPRGTLAIFHNSHGYAEQHQTDTISTILQAIDPRPTVDDMERAWARAGVEESGLFTDVEVHDWHAYPILTKEQYLLLLQTFSPFRRHTEANKQRALTEIAAAIDTFGGTVKMDIQTILVLGRAA